MKSIRNVDVLYTIHEKSRVDVYKRQVLDYKKTVKLEKLFTQLCEVLDEEMHYEQEERSQTI